MAKKLKEKTVRTHAIDAIGSQDKDSDILDSMIGAAKKTGGPLKYSVGGPIKRAWMRNR